MARLKLRSNDKEDTKPNRGPTRYPYVVYASKGRGEELRWLIEKWSTPQAARSMIEALKGDASYELKRSASDTWNYMLFEDGMRISLRDDEQHTEVMELEFDDKEETTYPSVAWFKNRERVESPTGGESDQAGSGDNVSKKSRRKAERKLQGDQPRVNTDKQPKLKKPRADKSGKISANDIAKELGLEGREVRGVLRAMGLVKPDGGWLFDEATADDIRKKVKDGHKKKAKK